MYVDDYWYQYMFIEDSFDMNRPIHSLKDILISQYYHYFGFNGRSIVHLIVQLFTGILGKQVFNVFNAIAFSIFIYLIVRLTSKINVINILFVNAIVFFLFPQFDLTVLWMSGSVNYLWTSIIICLFIILIEHLQTETIQLKHFVWFIFGIIAGWTHEGITFPLAISLCIYIFINRKTIRRQAVYPLIIAFIIGAFMCTFSPSTFTRIGMGDGIKLFRRIIIGISTCVEMKCLYVLLGIVAISFCFLKKDKWMQWLKDIYLQNIIICNALILSFGVVFLSGYMGARVGIGVSVFSIILILRILMQYDIANSIKGVICVGGCIVYLFVLYWTIKYHEDNQRVMSQIESRESNVILYEKTKIPVIVESYILKLPYEKIRNHLLAATYHYDNLYFIPETIYKDIISKNEKIEDINKQQDYSVYVVPIDCDYVETSHPYFILHPTDFDSLPFYIKPFASKLDRYSETEVPVTTSYGILDIEGHNYLFVEKNNMIDSRLKDIVLR